MLILLIKALVSCSFAYLWYTLSLVFKCLSISICCFVFDMISYSSGAHMALNINNDHIQCYHMDLIR